MPGFPRRARADAGSATATLELAHLRGGVATGARVAERLAGVAEVEPGIVVLRREGDGLLEAGAGFREAARHEADHAEVVPGCRQLGVELEGATVEAFGFLHLAAFPGREPEGEGQVSAFAAEGQGSGEGLVRFDGASRALQGDAEVEGQVGR